MTDKRYYVYTHRHPETHELVYVGKGCGGRAWDVTRNRGQHSSHLEWMNDLISKGYVPSDWVEILYKQLEEKEAVKKETEVLHSVGVTKFNRQSGERQHQAKLTNEEAIEIFKQTKLGVPHKELASRYGVSRSAVSMISSRKQWRAVTAGVTID